MPRSLSGMKSYQTQSNTVALDGVWIVRATLCIAAMETKQEIKGAVEKSGEGRMTLKLTDWIRNVSSHPRAIDMWLWHTLREPCGKLTVFRATMHHCSTLHSTPRRIVRLAPATKAHSLPGWWAVKRLILASRTFPTSSPSQEGPLSAIPAVIWAGTPNELCLSQRFPRNPFPLRLRTLWNALALSGWPELCPTRSLPSLVLVKSNSFSLFFCWYLFMLFFLTG
jgi:hypothetical protein